MKKQGDPHQKVAIDIDVDDKGHDEDEDVDSEFGGLRLNAKEVSSLIYSLRLFDAQTPGLTSFFN